MEVTITADVVSSISAKHKVQSQYLKQLSQQHNDLLTLQKSLQLKNSTELVNVGSNCFFQTMNTKQPMRINIGLNIFVEMNEEEIETYIEKEMKRINDEREGIQNDLAEDYLLIEMLEEQ
ncbi:Prefoldin_subunit-containing protein [Hexamita inflata]|uniref:Prefoldin_subunit-containing protein n=1 Tax=Hexamita inflata TaxID=28002 RepID=A0ABP1GWK9_9EUKA